MEKRSRLLVEPGFQLRLLMRLSGWVTLATVITSVIVFFSLTAADRSSSGDFFFIVPEAGAHPMLLKRTQIMLPAIGLSLIINLVLILAFALLYSQRLAGPVHRMTQGLLRLARGERPKPPFQLRGADELQDMARAFETLLISLEHEESEKKP